MRVGRCMIFGLWRVRFPPCLVRPRLLQDSSFSDLTTYETQDPVCQDALMSDVLINTRRYCAYVAARSAETCKLINLDAPM